MVKPCKERRAGRGYPRPSGLTQQGEGQMTEAFRVLHAGQRPFARLLRCDPLNMLAYPAGPRLADRQNSAAHRGKIIEYGPYRQVLAKLRALAKPKDGSAELTSQCLPGEDSRLHL